MLITPRHTTALRTLKVMELRRAAYQGIARRYLGRRYRKDVNRCDLMWEAELAIMPFPNFPHAVFRINQDGMRHAYSHVYEQFYVNPYS